MQRVALKVLRPHIVGDDEARRRLEREVGSLSRIRSRWVAEIVDADPWGPVPYVATRYVPGLSLHELVQEEGPVDGDDLWWLARCLADGVTSVHAAGVLHRDVKPSNVLMEGRTPILIDFGLARVADDPRLTHTGWLLGTPGYLAPEILHGEDATTASDVHSWGATVAYAGTGGPPFGRGPSMAVMDRVRRGEHRLDGLPPGLREIVTAALDPDPRRRPTLADAAGLARRRAARRPLLPRRCRTTSTRCRWRSPPRPTTRPPPSATARHRPRPCAGVGAAPGHPAAHRRVGGGALRPGLAARAEGAAGREGPPPLAARGLRPRGRGRGDRLPVDRAGRAAPALLAAALGLARGHRDR